ncbi:MAG: host-nuclease inhibitor Gam family protein [Magnetococcales bacterium]|nr:host-nuclease inhibitor Gam family protein [Magnetococcales bacterium]
MAATKRVKPKATVSIQNLEQADAVLAEIGEVQRQIDTIETRMNDAIDEIKEGASLQAQPLKERLERLSEGLAAFGDYQKEGFFKDRRTIQLTFGTLGFRKSSEIRAVVGKKLADVLDALKTHKFFEAIKKTEKVNKDVLRDWTDDRLALVHAAREEKDTFWYEIKEAEVRHG